MISVKAGETFAPFAPTSPPPSDTTGMPETALFTAETILDAVSGIDVVLFRPRTETETEFEISIGSVRRLDVASSKKSASKFFHHILRKDVSINRVRLLTRFAIIRVGDVDQFGREFPLKVAPKALFRILIQTRQLRAEFFGV